MKPTIDNLMNLLIGKRAKANHPITCLNPEEYFIIYEVKLENDDGRIFCRGENTCWFSANMLEVIL